MAGVVITSKGGHIKTAKTKWSTALNMTFEIEDILSNPNTIANTSGMAEKRELGKVRGVVTSNLPLYLKCSYVSQWVESWLHPKECSLFWSTSDQFNHRNNDSMLCNCKWAWPIDQSEFDHQINLEMVAMAVDVITNIAKINAARVGEVIDNDVLVTIKRDMTSGFVETKKGKVKHNNGVLSGWRWTALIDSIINLAEFFTALELAKTYEALTNWSYYNLVAQGDDISVWFDDPRCAVLMYKAYSEMGFKINAAKSFLDTSRNEFLRLVTTNGRVVGYPARCIPSILWRNPKGEIAQPGEDRINARITKWLKAINRGCNKRNVWQA